MDWNKAFNLLVQGKAVTKVSWKGFKYLKTMGQRIYNWEVEAGKNAGAFSPVQNEVDATDWEEFTGPFVEEPMSLGGETMDAEYFPSGENKPESKNKP